VLAVKHYGPKLFFAAAFTLTLGLKLLVYHPIAPADPEVLGKAVATFLLKQGFEARLETSFGEPIVHANAGKCRMLITEAAPQGWNRGGIELRSKLNGAIELHIRWRSSRA